MNIFKNGSFLVDRDSDDAYYIYNASNGRGVDLSAADVVALKNFLNELLPKDDVNTRVFTFTAEVDSHSIVRLAARLKSAGWEVNANANKLVFRNIRATDAPLESIKSYCERWLRTNTHANIHIHVDE